MLDPQPPHHMTAVCLPLHNDLMNKIHKTLTLTPKVWSKSEAADDFGSPAAFKSVKGKEMLK